MSGSFRIDHFQRALQPGDLPDGYLHLIVFGPGHGEAILIRMPDGCLGVVDGCIEPDAAKGRLDPVSELVQVLGEKRLQFACLTHPHDDHYKGFARLIQKYPPHHIWWSGAREQKLFDCYLEYLERKGGRVESAADVKPSADALEAVVSALNDAADRSNSSRARPKHLVDWTRLLVHKFSERLPPFMLESILPSTIGVSAAEKDALQGIMDLRKANKAGEILEDEGRRERRFDPNRISAALLLTWGRTRVLLGGDALCERDQHAGWDGLEFPLGKIQVVKAAHHASDGAHSERLWSEMQPDFVIVTCFQRASGNQPPRPEMLNKLLKSGSRVVVTSKPTWWDKPGHRLRVEGSGWTTPPIPTPAKIRGIERARTAPRLSNHDNAVVVRLDHEGQVVYVGLHGEARQLHLTDPGSGYSEGTTV